jgi:5,10-methenyltetrahydrofolate synthetase
MPVTGADDSEVFQREIAPWRKTERERLIAARLSVPADIRAGHSQAIAAALDAVIGDIAGKAVSLYWPFRGEPDLRPWMETLPGRGATGLLPVVVEKARPLIFRAWNKDEPLGRGVWNIPIPEQGPEITPDIVIAPLVGFDPECFRLGYGGGFFDRTLAAIGKPVVVIGVGYGQQEIASIRPQSHDIAMDAIVTENAVRRRCDAL